MKIQRFFDQIEMIGRHFDYIFLDMGAGATKSSMQFITAANEIFVVTTPEPTSITDAYAMVKYIHLNDKNVPIHLIVNRAESGQEAKETQVNFRRVTVQFLKKDLTSLGYIPYDARVTKSVKAQKPFLLLYPQTKASRSMMQMATTYLGLEDASPTKFGHFLKKMKLLIKK
ncbi:P-loop NTPase [Bacillus sp. JCM 19034]|uniref:MinD/ParA family ATP-binding protein n=1 Tax=Bacillus sp. JCM 19034 TaxID=1481928 RepID=UPI000AC1FF35|nr:P-loop NTPase [Bacillus sp. JCM 19034]